VLVQPRPKMLDALVIVVSRCSVACCYVVAQQQPKPNILFILADNIGYGDLGVYGDGELRGRRRRASTGSPPKVCG
jgi:hypothetical protein